MYEAREEALAEETARRTRFARDLAVGPNAANVRVLGGELLRLDEHWTRRGQKDPIVSDLFGERPRLFVRGETSWIELAQEIEYVAVLDRGLALVTFQEGEQALFHLERRELAALPPPPITFREKLRTRWERAGDIYDENDPLPRDLQYRRSYDLAQGIAFYYNYVTPRCDRALLLYSIGPEERVLRIVDLPGDWAVSALPPDGAPAPSP
jgi:hypothetical protein